MNVTVLISGNELLGEPKQIGVLDITHLPELANTGLGASQLEPVLKQLSDTLELNDLGPDSLEALDLQFLVNGIPQRRQLWSRTRTMEIRQLPLNYGGTQLWCYFNGAEKLAQATL